MGLFFYTDDMDTAPQSLEILQILHRHPQWSAINEIYHRLQRNGYKAFLAGGCVRDALLGRNPNDLDIATSASPDEVEKLFEKTVLVGKNFGVVRVLIEEADVEVATFRTDMEYVDGRHPEKVVFSSPQEDAQRRDFTINALFYDLQENKIMDYVEGQVDLNRQILRTVGEAQLRFKEDHLRLLRAARFSAQLNFTIAPETFQAMTTLAPLVKTVSGERLRDEMGKLLKTKNPEKGLEVMVRSGLMHELFPWFDLHKFKAAVNFPSGRNEDELSQKFSLFFQQASETSLAQDTKRLRMSTKEVRFIENAWQIWQKPDEFMSLRRGEQIVQTQKPGVFWALQVLGLEKKFADENRSVLETLVEWQVGLPSPLLNGDDVKKSLQGKAIGACLQEAYWLQLEQKLGNREDALRWLNNYLSKGFKNE